MKVAPEGPACHTGEVSCFFNSIALEGETEPVGPGILGKLYRILEGRRTEEPDDSYVASLYSKGLKKILEKVAKRPESSKRPQKRKTTTRQCTNWSTSGFILSCLPRTKVLI